MKPGDVFVFNNRTLVHSRNGFNLNGGNRHFQGVSTMASHFQKTLFVNELVLLLNMASIFLLSVLEIWTIISGCSPM